ncbi:MAG: hypothetical protein BGO41_09780 [Clostridiales bacterium 38-18]|nr:MAG: hypothetical protein BGO41_09780 [Clostridiales bacterium 38-18]
MSYIDQLFSYKKIYDQSGSEHLFIEAMRESLQHHGTNTVFWKASLSKLTQYKSVEDFYEIEPIPSDVFKRNEVLSVPMEHIVLHATSSGTSGQKSQIFLDQKTLDLGVKMIIKSMRYHGLFSLIPTNYIILGYEPGPNNAMGNTKVADGMRRFAPALHTKYAIRAIGNSYETDIIGVLETLKKYEKMRLPVRLLGFPIYLSRLLEIMDEMGMPSLKLSKKSVVLTGGGWKQFAGSEIPKAELRERVFTRLGIPKENIRDFYSAVEHSVAYPECENHHMHVPIWSRVVIRDVKTLKPLGYDQPGFLNFISPLVHSMPLSSVMMKDIAVLREGKTCGCGIQTPYFEVLGRAGITQGKTCAITAAELIGGEGYESV